jgi:WD40 repeat protein
MQFNFGDGSTVKLYEAMGNITALKYAPSGLYIAIGSEEGKAIIYEPQTGRREKCRPGHAGSICSLALSRSGVLLASMGADQNVLVYKMSEAVQPMEVARYAITKLEKCTDLTCSFNYTENMLFVSGAQQLQKLECV